MILTARLGSAQSTSGTGIEMDAIAAVILGGTSLSGGVGFVLPTVVGAMIMGIIDNILTLMNVNPHATNIVKGAVIPVSYTHLARAVLTAQGMYLAPPHIQMDSVQSFNARKCLHNRIHPQY